MSTGINCDKAYCDDSFQVVRTSGNVENLKLELENSFIADERSNEAVNAYRQLARFFFRAFVYRIRGYTPRQK